MPNLFTKVKDRARAAAQPKPRTTHQLRGQVDTPFLLLTVLLVVVGLVMLLSASYPTAYYDIKHVTGGDAFYYFKRQALFAVLGLVVMYLVSKVNYQGLRGLAVLVLVLACLCMLAVKLPGLGVTAGGATRWLKYPIQWQPSELGKFGLVLYFSSRLSQRDHRTPLGFRRNHALGRFGNLLERIGFFELIPYAFVIGIMVGILAIQHHMSATIQMVVIAAAVLFAGGISVWWFIVGGAGVGAALFAIIKGTDYMTLRIANWKNPWDDAQNKGLQAVQSMLAIGSGGVFGLGLGNGRQKFLYLPEPQNDFIFAVVCEQLGQAFGVLLLAVYVLLILRGVTVVARARRSFEMLLGCGVLTMLGIQTFMIVAGVIKMIPLTGVTMPFLSYGGSSLLSCMAMIGILHGASARAQENLEEDILCVRG